MAPTSVAPHPLQAMMRQGTARVCSHKIALLCASLISASHIFCPVGRDLCTILRFSMMPVELIFTSQVGSITLQMLALLHQTRCWSLITMCGIICLNGVVGKKRTLLIFS